MLSHNITSNCTRESDPRSGCMMGRLRNSFMRHSNSSTSLASVFLCMRCSHSFLYRCLFRSRLSAIVNIRGPTSSSSTILGSRLLLSTFPCSSVLWSGSILYRSVSKWLWSAASLLNIRLSWSTLPPTSVQTASNCSSRSNKRGIIMDLAISMSKGSTSHTSIFLLDGQAVRGPSSPLSPPDDMCEVALTSASESLVSNSKWKVPLAEPAAGFRPPVVVGPLLVLLVLLLLLWQMSSRVCCRALTKLGPCWSWCRKGDRNRAAAF
mmetsp:Transcript_33390/g.96457  ORF Transcript_33390/g.96457 Transcript_33390/m.96457 type:complete len:265 (-) Transcript_33390:905-1699(-)